MKIFKKIQGFPSYSITNMGEIYSHKNNIYLSQTNGRYRRVSLVAESGRTHNFNVHALTAKHYVPLVEGKTLVNHKDGNKWNNAATNLEWCTHAENMAHAKAMQLFKGRQGEASTTATITNEQALMIYSNVARGASVKEVATDFTISVNIVTNIIRGKTFKNLGLEPIGRGYKKDSIDTDELKHLFFKTGLTTKDLATRYSVSRTYIADILRKECGEAYTLQSNAYIGHKGCLNLEL